MVQVRRAQTGQWPLVKQVRLDALAEAPYAFGSTLERELAFEEEVWRRRVGEGDWFLAWAGDQVVGLAAAVTEPTHLHERHLTAMWVRPDHRGSDAATTIIDTVCRWAGVQGAQAVSLWVVDGNARARRLYERLGFTSTGQRQPLPSAPDVGEERLRRELTATDASGGQVDVAEEPAGSPQLGEPAGLRIRAATDQDAPAMAHLTRAAYQRYVERIGREPAPMGADYSRLRLPACAWVADGQDGLVGVLVCEWAHDHLLIENLAVDATHRGQGLGARLLAWAEGRARAAGVGEVRLYTNAAMHQNVAYYPQHGYRETHRAGQDGHRRIFFTKTLPPTPGQ